MSRKKKILKKNNNYTDPIYKSKIINLIINKITTKGKKSIAQKIFYTTIDEIKKKLNEEPLLIIKKIIHNITPNIEPKTKRIGGSVFSIPIQINSSRGVSIALSFLMKNIRKRSGKNIKLKLKNELLDAYNNTGSIIKKRDEINKLAETNKVFINYKLKKK